MNIIFKIKECCHGKSVHFGYKLSPIIHKNRGVKMLDLTIDDTQKVTVTLNPVTDKGTPAKLDGAPTWIGDGGGSSIIVASDGLSADLVSSDVASVTVFTVSADADLGAGVVTISDTITLNVISAMATNLGLVAGTPVAK